MAWLALMTAVYTAGMTDFLEPPGGTYGGYIIPLAVIALAIAEIFHKIRRNGPRSPMPIVWLAVLVGTLVVWTKTAVLGEPPPWLLQIALVPSGTALAASPLLSWVRVRSQGTDRELGNSGRTLTPESA